MAEAKGKCCEGCSQPCFVGQEKSCCPRNCQRCKKKGCTKDGCKCNDCNCGCKESIKGNKSCKDSGCPDCVGLCKDVKPGDKCLCSKCTCGCEEAFMQNKLCYENGYNKCPECKTKCVASEDGDCICYLCSCGCNGVNCQCCRRCNPETTCLGEGRCDAEETHGQTCPKGKCKENPGSCSDIKCKCHDMGVTAKHNGQCVCRCRCEQKCPRILCANAEKKGTSRLCGNSTKGNCTCDCKCNCNAYGKYYCKQHTFGDKGCDISKCEIIFYGIGQCRFKCTNCGRLCDQDRCMNWIRVIVIGLIIVASLFVMRAIFPEKYHAIMTKIRATFASSPRHPGRSLRNLVGDTVPEEMNFDLYPAFRPRTYAGLA